MPGKLAILHDQRGVELAPGVAVEIAANHLAVLRPGQERDGGAVDADETFAVIADERQQVGLLRVIHVQVAVGEKHHGIEGVRFLAPHFSGFLVMAVQSVRKKVSHCPELRPRL